MEITAENRCVPHDFHKNQETVENRSTPLDWLEELYSLHFDLLPPHSQIIVISLVQYTIQFPCNNLPGDGRGQLFRPFSTASHFMEFVL